MHPITLFRSARQRLTGVLPVPPAPAPPARVVLDPIAEAAAAALFNAYHWHSAECQCGRASARDRQMPQA